jgi:hypothetical protein
VLAEPSLPLRHSATISLRVAAENLTMTDLLMVCDVRGRQAQGTMCDGIILLNDCPHALPVLCAMMMKLLNNKSTFVSDVFKFLAVS